MGTKFMISFAEFFKKYEKRIILFSYFLSLFIVVLVYFTGGTHKVYSNFIYVPIAIVSSLSSRRRIRFVHALLCGLALGYFMPLNVSLMIPQETQNWILRLVIYLLISSIIGNLSDFASREYDTIMKKDKELHEAQLSTIFSLIRITETRDGDTGEHVERIVAFTKLLLTKLLESDYYKDTINSLKIDIISQASALHDIGKMAISDRILLKPGKLTEEEFEIMKTHTTIGANTLTEVQIAYPDNEFINAGLEITNYHHERWDGTGYPEGLKAEGIPFTARVVSIVDVYDSLRSKRVYKKQYSHEESIAIMKEGRYTQFDGKILDIFFQKAKEFDILYNK